VNAYPSICIPQQVQYKLAVTVHWCLRYSSSEVLRRLLRASLRSFRPPTSPFGQPSQTQYSAVSSQHIWHSGFLSHHTPTVWNSLPDSLRDPAVESETHLGGKLGRRISLPDIRDMSALQMSPFHRIALYKSTFTHLVTTVTVMTEVLPANCSRRVHDARFVFVQSSVPKLSM